MAPSGGDQWDTHVFHVVPFSRPPRSVPRRRLRAPYVSGAYAAGTLTLGCWDHWVPGANKALDKLCKEWGDKNKVEVHIDYITSQGEKDKLTAAAEAQAGTGHDIMSHRDWNIRIHQAHARAARRRHRRAHQEVRPDQPGRRISRQEQRRVARRADRGRQPGEAVLLALRSLQAARRHRSAAPCSRPTSRNGTRRKTDKWTWDALCRVGAEAAQGRLPGRPADGSDLRRGRLGRRAVQRLRRRCSSTPRTTSRSTPTRPGRRWKSPARSWKRARPKCSPGTTPATTAG